MNFFKTSKWKKIVIELQGAQGHDLHLCGRDMTDALWDETHAPMFFAHYSEPLTGKVQVEIKVELDWSHDAIDLFFRRTSLWAAQYVQKVSTSPFNESPAHAQAYLLSRLLRGKGEEQTKDVLHWMLNMTGYTYPQEIKLLGEHVAHLAGNIEKGMP
jgi:hypothetical protein